MNKVARMVPSFANATPPSLHREAAWPRAHRLLAFPILGALLACATPVPGAPQAVSAIDTVAILRHARVLSDDSMLGRATGTRQLEESAHYIASVCAEIGLRPLGRDYLLEVPLTRMTFTDATVLTIEANGEKARFVYGRDFIINFAPSTLQDFAGAAVLVGTDEQVRAVGPEGTLDAAVAVTLGTVSPQASHNLSERGALAMIHLVSDTGAYTALRDSRGATQFVAAEPGGVSSFAPNLPSIVAAPHLSQQLYNALNAGARLRIGLQVGLYTDHVVSHNVACVLRGSAPRPERKVIAFTAHYDHLGVESNGMGGDSIYNGFSDNAVGVGMLLAIAQSAARPAFTFRNDMVFLFFTAEEIGLLGSDYFVAHPPASLENFSAVINLDAGAPPARAWSWRIAGGDQSSLGRLAVDVALAQGWSATTSPAVPNSDYFPFWRVGVPAIFIVPGVETFEGLSADSSRGLRQRWDRYHQVGDEWKPGFPLEGLQRYATYAFLIARRIDAYPESF